MNETIRLLDDKPYGTLWYDRSFSMLVVHGFVNPDLILGDISAIRAATNYLNGIVWADEQGQT